MLNEIKIGIKQSDRILNDCLNRNVLRDAIKMVKSLNFWATMIDVHC